MKTKITKTKQEFCWHFVDVYLELLSQIYAIREDKVFFKKLCDLENYLDEKLSLGSEEEIVDTYVVVLQQSEN